SVEHSLHTRREASPLRHGTGRILLEEEDANNSCIDLAHLRTDTLALRPLGKIPPADGLVEAVAQPHARLRRACPGGGDIGFTHAAPHPDIRGTTRPGTRRLTPPRSESARGAESRTNTSP